jgi:hypothetical protein
VVIRVNDLNWRQKWEGCLKPSSKATTLTDFPERSNGLAAQILCSLSQSCGERPNFCRNIRWMWRGVNLHNSANW